MKKEKRDLIASVMAGVLLAFANVAVFYYKVRPRIQGMAISDVKEILYNLDFSLIIFLAEWILVVLIIFIAYFKFMKHFKDEKLKVSYSSIKESKKKGSTDIDLLYSLLKQRKHAKINVIAKVFNIGKDKALEWAKILENHDLVSIEYPTFSDPEVELKQ